MIMVLQILVTLMEIMSPVVQQHSNKQTEAEFDRLFKLFTDSRYRLSPSSTFGSLV